MAVKVITQLAEVATAAIGNGLIPKERRPSANIMTTRREKVKLFKVLNREL